jgi:hypothetical protein
VVGLVECVSILAAVVRIESKFAGKFWASRLKPRAVDVGPVGKALNR